MSDGFAVKARPMIAARERGPGPGRYLLPSSTGSNNHDATKTKQAAYSFGTKLPNSIFKQTPGPGPAHKVADNLTRNGVEEKPKYTMAGRAKDFKSSRTPAPGAYSPENVTVNSHHAAEYTMRPRTNLRKTDKTPAANAYDIPTTMASTKESGKKQAPIYSMTGRSNVGGFAEDLAKAPAPCKYNQTDANVTKPRQPLYTMRARTQMPQDGTKKPGPGAHRPESVVVHKPKAPQFSMGVRHSDYLTPLIVDVPDF